MAIPDLRQRPGATAAPPELMAGLIDYAGIAPPTALPLAAARNRYVAHQRGPYRDALGAFLLRADQVGDLLALHHGDPMPVVAAIPSENTALVIDDTLRVTEYAALRLVGLHLALPTVEAAWTAFFGLIRTSVPDHLSVAVEIPISGQGPQGAALDRAMNAVAEEQRPMAVKLRFGGVTPQATPPLERVAEALATAASHGLPIRGTAGLHTALSNLDGAWPHYGYLNVLIAALVAASGGSAHDIAEALGDPDEHRFAVRGDAITWADHEFGLRQITHLRRNVFLSYGSCSFAEPTADARRLGLLEGRRR